MSLYPQKSYPLIKGPSELDILKASHKFLRDEPTPNDPSTSNNTSSWQDQLAEKYYSNLYREFAVCDLKHYKTGNFALRWRTESEVLSGAGESTCANTRCKRHHEEQQRLTTLELPFAYTEHGESKHALVKVVLCSKCVKKLMWKRQREKGKQDEERAALMLAGADEREDVDVSDASENPAQGVFQKHDESGEKKKRGEAGDGGKEEKDPRLHLKSTTASDAGEHTGKQRHREENNRFSSEDHRSRRRSSRSRSPRRASHHHPHSRKRSPKGDRNT